MDLLREKMKCRGGLGAQLMGGLFGTNDSSTSTQGATTHTTNTDKRVANQDGVALSGDGSYITTNYQDNSNSPDAVKAIAAAGADIIKTSGGAVVDLARFQSAQNTDAWNATLTTGANLVDKLIGQVAQGFTLSAKVVDSFQPEANKQTDALKYGLIAAAAIAAAVLLKGSK